MAPRIIKLLKGNKRKHNQGPTGPVIRKPKKDRETHVRPEGYVTVGPTEDRRTVGPTEDREVIGPTKGRRRYGPTR